MPFLGAATPLTLSHSFSSLPLILAWFGLSAQNDPARSQVSAWPSSEMWSR